MDIFLDSLRDAFIDTLFVLPILYLAYLLVGYFSHNDNEKYAKILHHTKKAGPLVGAFLGCVPQCGFSSMMSQLYSKKVVTLGTLMAVFIATSDEAIPLMISQPKFIPQLLVLLAIKVVLGIVMGYVVDLIIMLVQKKKEPSVREFEESHHHHLHGECCAKNIFLEALKHTLIITLYVFLATLIINLIIGYAGMDALRSLFTTNVYTQILIAALVGLIPNCAASVFLVELYMAGVLHFAALVGGLCAGAGVGLIVLFTTYRKHIFQNLGITGMLYLFAIAGGFLTSVFSFF